MNLRSLGQTSLRVSEFCLGTMTMGWQNDEAESVRILDRAWDAGINFYDTADVYSRWVPGNPGGVSEQILGKWLKTKPRDKIVVATKVRGQMWDGPDGEGLSRSHILRACEDSLRRLGIDVIDLYQCHAPDPNTPIEETVDVLGDLVKQGKVRYLGVSNFPSWLIFKANHYAAERSSARFDTTQPKYNLIYRHEFEKEHVGLVTSEKIAVIPYSPLEGGLLTGKYRPGKPLPENARHTLNQQAMNKLSPRVVQALGKLEEISKQRGETMTQTALAWMLSRPYISSPIIGATSVAQLEDSLAAAGKRLSPEESQALDDASGGL